MLAKIYSLLRYAVYGINRKWQEVLPTRYISGSLFTTVPTGKKLEALTRGLSATMDGLAAQLKAEQNGGRQ